jgi:hypothetical protein
MFFQSAGAMSGRWPAAGRTMSENPELAADYTGEAPQHFYIQ